MATHTSFTLRQWISSWNLPSEVKIKWSTSLVRVVRDSLSSGKSTSSMAEWWSITLTLWSRGLDVSSGQTKDRLSIWGWTWLESANDCRAGQYCCSKAEVKFRPPSRCDNQGAFNPEYIEIHVSLHYAVKQGASKQQQNSGWMRADGNEGKLGIAFWRVLTREGYWGNKHL